MFRTFAKASVSAGGGVPAGQAANGSSSWHPTVVYLAVLVAAEFALVGFLTHHLLKED